MGWNVFFHCPHILRYRLLNFAYWEEFVNGGQKIAKRCKEQIKLSVIRLQKLEKHFDRFQKLSLIHVFKLIN